MKNLCSIPVLSLLVALLGAGCSAKLLDCEPDPADTTRCKKTVTVATDKPGGSGGQSGSAGPGNNGGSGGGSGSAGQGSTAATDAPVADPNEAPGLMCPAGQHACSGKCVDNTSVDSCGSACDACPTVTGGKATCDGTKCGVECPAGQKACQGACIATTAPCDVNCAPGTHDCNGVCANNNQVGSCGSSCVACPLPPPGGYATCDGTKCDFACERGKRCDNKCGDCCSDNDCPPLPGKVVSCDLATLKCRAVCPAGQVDCNGQCIPMGGCCKDTDCPMTDGKVGKCDSSSRKCEYMCAADSKPCGGKCIPLNACCDDKACNGNFACVNNSCSNSVCQAGFKLCNGACIPDSRCCDDRECGANRACRSGMCVTTCTPGASCNLGRPCRAGRISCENGAPVCVDNGPDDAKAGCPGGNHCRNGACVSDCVSGQACTQGIGPCRRGTTFCASPTSQAECRDGGADDSRQTCGGGQTCSGGKCITPCQGGGSCTDGIAACRKGTWVCNSAGQRTCMDAGIDSAANDSQQRCPNGNVCKSGTCAPRCTSGAGPSAGCPNGQYCDTSASPRRCVSQKKAGTACKDVAGECDGNTQGCINGVCCHKNADICDPPGRGCCSWFPAPTGPVDQCNVDGTGCASLSCNTSNGKCR
jgi:hypothetical protein